jgi:hypothetical protein
MKRFRVHQTGKRDIDENPQVARIAPPNCPISATAQLYSPGSGVPNLTISLTWANVAFAANPVISLDCGNMGLTPA